jgi:hypothetical protein
MNTGTKINGKANACPLYYIAVNVPIKQHYDTVSQFSYQ